MRFQRFFKAAKRHNSENPQKSIYQNSSHPSGSVNKFRRFLVQNRFINFSAREQAADGKRLVGTHDSHSVVLEFGVKYRFYMLQHIRIEIFIAWLQSFVFNSGSSSY